jgi:hypothetical protein
MRLCRLMCGRPVAFRSVDHLALLGWAQGWAEPKPADRPDEAHSASTRRAAEPRLRLLNEPFLSEPLAHDNFRIAARAVDFIVELAHFVGGDSAVQFRHH